MHDMLFETVFLDPNAENMGYDPNHGCFLLTDIVRRLVGSRSRIHARLVAHVYVGFTTDPLKLPRE